MQIDEIVKSQTFIKLNKYSGLTRDLEAKGYTRNIVSKAFNSSQLTLKAVQCLSDAEKLCKEKLNEVSNILNQA